MTRGGQGLAKAGAVREPEGTGSARCVGRGGGGSEMAPRAELLGKSWEEEAAIRAHGQGQRDPVVTPPGPHETDRGGWQKA